MVISERWLVTRTVTLTAELEAIKKMFTYGTQQRSRDRTTGWWHHVIAIRHTVKRKVAGVQRTLVWAIDVISWKNANNVSKAMGKSTEIKGKRKRHTSTAQTQHTENRQHLHRQTIEYEDWLYTKIKINFMQCNQQYTNIKQCIEQQMFTQCKYRSI